MTADEKQAVEDRWLERWKSRTRVSTKPRVLMTNYLESHELSIDQLDEEMDWACWPIQEDESL